MKTAGFVLLWLVGSGAAVAVAWQGVNIVDNQVINPPHATLATPAAQGNPAIEIAGATPDDPEAPTEVSEASTRATDSDGTTDADDTGVASASPTADPNGSATPTVDPATDDDQATPQPTSRPVPTPRATAKPNSGGGSARPTPRASPTGTPSPIPQPSAEESPSPSGSPTVPDGPPETHTFQLVGGKTSVYFSSTSVEVLSAQAFDGYTVKIEQRGSNRVRVQFESEDGRSRLDASWNGSAQWEISEN